MKTWESKLLTNTLRNNDRYSKKIKLLIDSILFSHVAFLSDVTLSTSIGYFYRNFVHYVNSLLSFCIKTMLPTQLLIIISKKKWMKMN